MSVKIEVLFPEFANLFGDGWNMGYLRKCMPDAEFIESHFSEEPRFAGEDVQMVYMGAMTENQQELVIKKLMPYRERLLEMVDSGVVFLMTANAGEVFCEYIENGDGTRIEGLNLFPLHSKRDMMHRLNAMELGEFEGMKIVGFKAEFSHLYGDNSGFRFMEVSHGCGINPETKLEGVKINNFIYTSLVGPFLTMNPLMVKYFMKLLGVENPVLAHEEVIMAAYERRLKEFENLK